MIRKILSFRYGKFSILLSAAIMAATAGRAVIGLYQFSQYTVSINKSTDIITASNRLITALIDAESASRAFIITNHETYVNLYTKDVGMANTEITAMMAIVQNNSVRLAKVKEIAMVSYTRIAELSTLIEMRRVAGFDLTARRVETEADRHDHFRADAETLLHNEEHNVAELESASSTLAEWTAGNLLCSVIALFVWIILLLKKPV